MGRRRMGMKLIENEKGRSKVFKKRRNNLLKKAKELSILCDSKALLVVYELDKQKPEIWPHNDEEAKEFINKFKQQSGKGFSKNACDSIANKKEIAGEKFAISAHKSMINHLSENDLRKLCCDLDAKIAAVMNAIESKHRSPKMLGGSERIGFLDKKKEKEVVIRPVPVHTQQDQRFQMLSNSPNFMESPLMMMQNGVSYPEFGGRSSNPADWMQPTYMDANSSMGYYDFPPEVYYSMIPGFPSQMNP